MRIKTTKQMRLDELIKYVWENELKADNKLLRFVSQVDSVVEVDMSGQVRVYGQHYGNELFTVEVEEKLTEDTLIQDLADVFFDPLVGGPNVEYHTDCIKNIKQDGIETYSLAIFYKDTLIWSKDTGIPAEGVIECS